MRRASGASFVKKTADRADRLREGLAALHLSPELQPPLERYLDELLKWNAHYNLTAVRDPAEMVTRHLLDSLSVLGAWPSTLDAGCRLLDVGSGAGLPGVPLALARPDWQVDVLDSNGKKARFLRHVQRVLGLGNLRVIELRVEAYQPAMPYDAVISRAFSALDAFVEFTAHLLDEQGCWLAMKARLDDNRAAPLPPGVIRQRSVPLAVPGLAEERHLLILSRSPEHPHGNRP